MQELTSRRGSHAGRHAATGADANAKGKRPGRKSEAGRHAEAEFLNLVGRLLQDWVGVVDAQWAKWRSPDQARACRSAPLHARACNRHPGDIEVVTEQCGRVDEEGSTQPEALFD